MDENKELNENVTAEETATSAPKKKMKLGKKILIGVLALVGAGAIAAGAFFLPDLLKGDTEEEVEAVPLFYNIDRYTSLDEKTNESIRSINRDDGFYHVRFATDENRLVDYRVADKALVAKIDENNIVSLERNDKGLVVDVKTLDEIGYKVVIHNYYVQDISNGTVYMNSSSAGLGIEVDMKEEDIKGKIIDISGYSGDPGTQVSSLQLEDRVLAIANQKDQITHYWLTERYEISEVKEYYCDACQEVKKWKAWLSTDSLPKAASRFGHYYLANDVYLTSAQTTASSYRCCLDLNGKTVERDDGRVLAIGKDGSKLNILDYSEEQTGRIVTHGEGTLTGGIISCGNVSTVGIYGGTLDASDVEFMGVGTALYLGPGSTFNMYGGEIIGGTNRPRIYTSDVTGLLTHSGAAGATIYCDGYFNMYGGVIRDGICLMETYIKQETGKITYAGGYGGNIYFSTNAEVLIAGGTIKNGEAHQGGGNIVISSNLTAEHRAIFTMTGGTIEDGHCEELASHGGNICIWGPSVVNISGGTIKGGIATNQGGNLSCTGQDAEITISGGEFIAGKLYNVTKNEYYTDRITENIYIYNGHISFLGGHINGRIMVWRSTTDKSETINPTVTIGGSAQIYGDPINPENPCDLRISEGVSMFKPIEVLPFNPDAKIKVQAYGVFSGPAASEALKYVESDWGSAAPVQMMGGKLFIGQMHCVCGGSVPQGEAVNPSHTACNSVIFKPWESKTGLPTTDGNYYLLFDVQMKGQASIAKDANVVLCLNGHTVKGKDATRMYSVHNETSHLTITDCHKQAQAGRLVGSGEMTAQGGCVWVRYNDFSLYRGTLDGSRYTNATNGTALCIQSGPNFANIYGGELIGGTIRPYGGYSSTGTYSVRGTAGAAVNTAGTINMYAGIIRDGRAVRDLAFYNESTGKTSAQGGYGGNVYIGTSGRFNMYGGTIQNGKSGSVGANVMNEGVFHMYGGVVKGGDSSAKDKSLVINPNNTTYNGANGGNIYCSAGMAEYKWNGVMIDPGLEKQVIIEGGEVLDGKAFNGGNISCSGPLTITGGHIGGNFEGNNVEAFENILIYGATANLSGGVIDGYIGGTARDGSVKNPDGTTTAVKYQPDVILSGTIQINEGRGLALSPPSARITVGELKDGAKIVVAAASTFSTIISDPVYAKQVIEKGYFVTQDKFDKVTLTDLNELTVTDGAVRETGCICGGNCEALQEGGSAPGHVCQDQTWNHFRAKSNPSLKQGTKDNHTKYYYYLMEDVTMTGTLTVPQYCDFYLDLCGHTLTAPKDSRAFLLWQDDSVLAADDKQMRATLGICDSVGGGKLQMNGIMKNADGGLINLTRSSVLNLYGGEITGGQARSGGNIFSSSSTVNIYGGKVTNGYATNAGDNTNVAGGNISASSGTINLYGGEITGGKTDTVGGGIYLPSTTAMNVVGKVKVTDNVAVSGGKSNLYKAGTAAINIKGELKEGSQIGISMGTSADAFKGTFAVNAKETDLNYFFADIAAAEARKSYVADMKTLRFDYDPAISGHTHCECGGNSVTATPANGHNCEAEINWEPWNSTSAPDAYFTEDQYFYLEEDMTISTWSVKGTGVKLHLCLNGHTLKGSSDRVFMFWISGKSDIGATLTICDCGTAGTIQGGPNGANNGGTIVASEKTNFKLYGGTILNGKSNKSDAGYGGNVATWGDATFTMYGGLITGGKAYTTSGNVHAGSPFTMYGGTISGGKAASGGGNLFVASTVKLLGGEIIGGTSEIGGGGVHFASGSLTIGGDMKIKNNQNADETKSNICLTSSAPSIKFVNPGDGMQIGVYRTDINNGYVSLDPIDDADSYDYLAHITSDKEDGDLVKYELTKRLKLSYVDETHVDHCVCGGHCAAFEEGGSAEDLGHVCDDTVKWQFISTAEELIEAATNGGSVYLGADITLSARLQMKQNLNICLNGHKIKQSGDSRVLDGVATGITINLCDCTAETDAEGNYTAGAIVPKTTAYAANGAGIALNYNCTMNIYDGIIANGIVSGTGTGANVYIAAGATMNMFGGQIKNGKNTSTGYAGNLAINVGTFNMYGGEILDGSAKNYGGNIGLNGASNLNIYGGTIKGGKAEGSYGGNIMSWGAGNITIAGGEILDGDAKTNGGNIYTTGNLSISGGRMIGGTAGERGDNIYIGTSSSAKVLSISESEEVRPVITVEKGDNLFINDTLRAVSISGGYIYHQNTEAEDEFAMEPAMEIAACDKTQTAISGGYFGKIDASAVFTATDNPFIKGAYLTAEDDVETYYIDARSTFTELEAGDIVTVEGTEFTWAITPVAHENHCICGGEVVNDAHTEHALDVTWTGISTIKELRDACNDGGNYYLNASIDLGDKAGYPAFYLNVAAGKTVTICLNGNNLTQSGDSKVFVVGEGSTLNICDCQATTDPDTGDYISGTVSKTGAYAANGAGITVAKNATANIYGGTFTGLKTTSGKSGGFAAMEASGATLIMHGGLVKNCEATGTGASGGFLYISGSGNAFKMYGGTVKNCKASGSGGAIAFAGGTTANNTVDIIGGLIENSEAVSYGGTVYIPDGEGQRKVTVSGGELKGGKVTGTGTSVAGGNFMLGKNAVLEVTGGKITGGVAPVTGGNGGNIAAWSNCYSITISGGEISGGSAKNGGNIGVTCPITISGGEIKGGTATGTNSNGGNVYANGNVTITGGIFKDATATGTGTNVFFGGASGKTVTISGTDPLTMPKFYAGNADKTCNVAFAGNGEVVKISGGFFGVGTVSEGGARSHGAYFAKVGAPSSECEVTGGYFEEAFYYPVEYPAGTPGLTATFKPVKGGYYTSASGSVDVRLAPGYAKKTLGESVTIEGVTFTIQVTPVTPG